MLRLLQHYTESKMVSLSRPIRPVMAASTGPRPRHPSWKTVLASVGTPLVLGQAVGLWSTRDILQWYPKLKKPNWTPPVQFFGPTWAALYCAMGLAAHRVWAAGAGQGVMVLYVVQLALNLCWQPLVSDRHSIQTSTFDDGTLPLLSLSNLSNLGSLQKMSGACSFSRYIISK